MPLPLIDNAALLQRRNAYAYPAVAIQGSPPQWLELNLPSTTALDAYINQNLQSANDEDVILGYISALFWGHASSADGRDIRPRAHGKIRLAYHGQDRVNRGKKQRIRGIQDIGEATAVNHIRTAIQHLQNDNYTLAISELNQLPQLQIAFSSKLCTFIAPEKCGVMDSRIAKTFPELGFTLRGGYVANSTHNRYTYTEYCLDLQNRADELNNDPAHARWTDRDGIQRPWRAADVERALYC